MVKKISDMGQAQRLARIQKKYNLTTRELSIKLENLTLKELSLNENMKLGIVRSCTVTAVNHWKSGERYPDKTIQLAIDTLEKKLKKGKK